MYCAASLHSRHFFFAVFVSLCICATAPFLCLLLVSCHLKYPELKPYKVCDLYCVFILAFIRKHAFLDRAQLAE